MTKQVALDAMRVALDVLTHAIARAESMTIRGNTAIVHADEDLDPHVSITSVGDNWPLSVTIDISEA